MASYFGECSRAFVSENEDISAKNSTCKPSFKVNHHEEFGNKKIYDYLILVTDDLCSGFATSYFNFQNAKRVASIEEVCTTGNVYNESKPPQIVTAELYQLKQSILLLRCLDNLNPLKAHALLSNIVPWIKLSKEVIVLSSKNVEDFKYCKRNKEPDSFFCRALKTKSYKRDVGCPLLESPNTVIGFPAAVISWCQYENLQCVLYIFYYTKQMYLVNSLDITVLLKLCDKLNWYEEVANKSNDGIKDRITIRSGKLEDSNMYL